MNRRGFTLIELLLAVGLSALMVGGVMGTYLGIRRGVRESLVRHEAEMEGSLMIRRLGWDLESAYLGNPTFPDRFAFEGRVTGRPWQTSRLSFVSMAAGESGETTPEIADLGRVTYRLVPSEKREETYLLYRDLAPIGMEKPVLQELISDRVASLRVAFVDRNTRYFRQWDTRSQAQRDKLPRLIKLELSLWDSQGRRHTFRLSVHPMQDWME